MPEAKKTGAGSKPASFNVANLTEAQKVEVVADYIGIHPKYFHYRGAKIEVDIYKMSMDGVNWTGFPANHKGHLG